MEPSACRLSIAVGAGRRAGVGALILLRRGADRDHVPGEVRAAERVLDAVAVDLARRVLGERVQRGPVERDLLGAVGPFHRPQLAGHIRRAGRSATGGHRLPDLLARAGAVDHPVRLLRRRVQRVALGVDEDGAGAVYARCHHRLAAGAGRRGGGGRVAVRPAGRERERGDHEGDDGQCCGAEIDVHARVIRRPRGHGLPLG